ncbi:Predicted membrane protein [Microbacterium sp. C448]|uniref:DUF805 domain-containing protein n=1 Tax=Microbacterium TaxID=33882 RepID=UPI0003DE1035|nr:MULTISPECIES: DUF805 domain-containing protein [Microbacterium]CDK00756.1 Predicted membrane protein [Microbacterium sp. C448]
MSAPLDRPLYGASWGSAIARFFGNYSIFRGRASRSEYWWWVLTNALIIIVLNTIAAVSGAEGWQNGAVALPLAGGPGGVVTTVPGAIALIYGLGTLLPNLALTWRRLHDTDRSGAWFFLTFLPVIGWIVLFFFLIGSPREEGRRFD